MYVYTHAQYKTCHFSRAQDPRVYEKLYDGVKKPIELSKSPQYRHSGANGAHHTDISSITIFAETLQARASSYLGKNCLAVDVLPLTLNSAVYNGARAISRVSSRSLRLLIAIR